MTEPREEASRSRSLRSRVENKGPAAHRRAEEFSMTISISESASDHSFLRRVKKTSGIDIFKCYQCGTCTGVCPMGDHMDFGPRKIIHMSRLRMEDRVSSSNTPWVCAACSECLVRCPNGVDIPKVMEAFRLLTQRKNINYVEPSQMAPEDLAKLPQIALVGCFRKHTA
jgi:heterodisulfide reductase subunit C2